MLACILVLFLDYHPCRLHTSSTCKTVYAFVVLWGSPTLSMQAFSQTTDFSILLVSGCVVAPTGTFFWKGWSHPSRQGWVRGASLRRYSSKAGDREEVEAEIDA